MPLQVTDPIETVERLTTQEVLDFRLTQSVPDGVKSVSLLLAALTESGGHASPPRQQRHEIPLLEESGDIHVPESLADYLPAEIKAIQVAAGLTDQQLASVVFGYARAWSYAVFRDAEMLADGELL